MKTRAFRPDVYAHEDWRPAILTAVNGGTATLKVWLHVAACIVTREVSTADVPADNRTIGGPLVVRVSNDDPHTFAVVQIAPGQWGSDRGTGRDEDRVNDGTIPIIPKRLTGAPDEWDWTAGG